LSYAWGTDSTIGLIKINNKPWEISDTVEHALREICHQNFHSYVWVDQICINQRDAEEKSLQVMRMRQIYSSASTVVAWLGSSFRNSDTLFTYLQRLGNGIVAHDWKGLAALHDNDAHVQEISEAFNVFCLREYWTRLWIMQEFSMGLKVVIMCGSSIIPYEVLAEALDSSEAVATENRARPAKAKARLMRQIDSIFSSPSFSFCQSVVNRRYKYRDRSYGGDDFFHVVTSCLILEVDYNYPITSDPRDRVFALLYLSTDSYDFSHLIDYSKSCQRVYQETALAFFGQGHIDLLAYCQFPKTIPDLPSWVPDWNMPLRYPCTKPPWVSKFSASGNTAHKQEMIEVQPGRLEVKGVALDTVISYGNVWDPDWDTPLDRATALAFIDEVFDLCNQSPRVRVGEERLEACRIAACDGVSYGAVDISGNLMINYLADFLHAYHWLRDSGKTKNGKDVAPDDDNWLVRELHYLHTRRPFITKTGYVGLGPMHLEEEDEICILYGSVTPYIVRRYDEGGFTLIGEAFVHGAMYGEALRGAVEERVYVLR
jgi:hypothetical protein